LGSRHGFHLLSIASGFILMYPRAARERVLFEQAVTEWKNGAVLCQRLLLPESVPCSPQEARVIREQVDLLNESGFEIAPFGDDTFLLEGVPSWMQHVPATDLLHALSTDLEKGKSIKQGSDAIREHMARSCCRIASAHHPPLSSGAVLQLLRQLSQCEMPYTTPFGKPTLLHLGTEEFRRKFGLA
jgi:DNA mismatch repair protein MutL